MKVGYMIAVIAIIMGFGLTGYLAYLTAVYALNIVFTGIFSFLALLAAGSISVVSVGTSWFHGNDAADDLRDRHAELVQSFKNIIDRLDDVCEDLTEIDEIMRQEE